MKPKAILFDWDNTLVNTWPIIHAALTHTFTEMGHEPWPLEKTKANVRKSMRDAFPDIFGDAWEKAAELYQTQYRATHLQHLEALPQAEDVLKYVKEQGWFCAVVSNKKNFNLRKELSHIGWEPYFNAVVGADDAARDKPHPDPVHLAMKNSGILLDHQVWFVGDSEVDIEVAHATGCLPVLYGDTPTPDGHVREGMYGGFKVAHVVPDHQALLSLLKEM